MIKADYNGFGGDLFIEYQQWKPVGAGSKPALVPNYPSVALCHIY